MALTFQQLGKQNFPSALSLRNQCHMHAWSEKTFIDCLNAPYFAFSMQSHGQTVGYAIGMCVAGEATLIDIGVDEQVRGNGFGDQMLTQFTDTCQKHKATEIWLEVRESNLAAIRLYEKHGFSLIDRRKHYYPTESGREDALVMRKEIE